MILPSVILAPLGLVALGGGLEAMKSQPLLGLLCCAGGALVFGFLIFCLMLHFRAQQLWAWHVRTGRMPYFRKHGFLKGALLGGGIGLVLVAMAAWFGARFAEHPVYGPVAVYAFYGAFLYGVVVIGALAVAMGWAKRAWDRTSIPPR
ncbi:hypothetical protein KHA79_14105 [Xanthomonas translucens pv. cerealis]|nr:hypothetical protein KHA79_14105 [Xanthomonas translucens pv. cerealis]